MLTSLAKNNTCNKTASLISKGASWPAMNATDPMDQTEHLLMRKAGLLF